MKLHYLFLLLALACTHNDGPVVLIPEKPSENGDTVVVKETLQFEEFSTSIPELSGLCLNVAGSALMAVSDRGGIYEINFNGSTVRKLTYSGGDLEGITVDKENATFYVVDESAMTINQLSKDESSIILVKKITDIGQLDPSKGLEGITYGRDTIYVVNQDKPTMIIKYSLRTAEEKKIIVNFATFLSDIFYDDSDHTLWICDSKSQKIFHCTLDGVVIAIQKIPVLQCEALAIDRVKGFAYAGSDTGDDASKLYKIKLEI